jgi:mannose-6-phosphate isomerase-like protein (cupin superfamily)
MIEEVVAEGQLLAIIVRGSFKVPGVHFFTPGDFSQQLAYMSHPKGKQIRPHVHNPVDRKISLTQEVLIIKKGLLRVDFFDDGRNYIGSHVLGADDMIVLASGGHGFEVLESLEMIEVKQGPYSGDEDKTQFAAVAIDQIKMLR